MHFQRHITKMAIHQYLLVFLVLMSPASLLAANSILIIKSSDNPFFTTTIERLIDSTQGQAKFSIKSVKSLADDNKALVDARIIITLGYEAAKFSAGFDITAPVIHSYLTEFQHHSHKPKANHHSILLEQPLERYARFIKLLLSVDTIGIVKPADDPVAKERLNQIKQSLNINIQQTVFRNGGNAVNAVRELLEHNDVLLTLPAPQVYNRQTLKGILLSSYRLNKPVISYSPAHVKSGALAAIFTSPENIGKQLARLLDDLLKDNGFKPEPYYYASEFDIVINQRVADSLNLNLPDKDQLLQQLRQEGTR